MMRAWTFGVERISRCLLGYTNYKLFFYSLPFKADYFASVRSHRMKTFYTRFGCGETKGIDAFSVDWGKGFGYFHPAVGCVVRVVRYAEWCRARGILLVPD